MSDTEHPKVTNILDAVLKRQERVAQDDELVRLRNLRTADRFAYERERKAAADRLGIGVSALDEIVGLRDNCAGEESSQRESQATQIVKLARAAGVELFHDGEECFGTFSVNGHLETYALKSRSVRRWLNRLYFEQTQKAPSGEAVRSAIDTLAALAVHKGEQRKTHLRVASHGGNVYLDLCNASWQVVEIRPSGWRIIASKDCPVRFRRSHGMGELPMPERGGKVDELRRFLNVASDEDFKLVVACLLGCYRDQGPFPVLVEHGEQGSAKTTTARVYRDLIDPNVAPVRSEPRDERDLMVAANNGWVCAFDNLSHLRPWLSDALCRLATGGGFSTRELYTDSDEVIFQAERPTVLTGIEELATRGDLLDRAIIVYLPRISDEKRRTEEKFYTDFEEARPRIIGALLDAVSCALREVAEVKLDRLPRMADFAKWATAAESALGWEPGSFMRAYNRNRSDANELALEASPVAAAIQTLKDNFEGTSTDLLTKLSAIVDEKTRALKSWPRSPQALSNALRRLAPNLAAIGIMIAFEKPSRKTGARRLITITTGPASAGISSSPPTPSTPRQQNQGFSGDDSGDAGDDSCDFATPLSTPKNPTKSRGGDGGDAGDTKFPAFADGDGNRMHGVEI